MSLSLFWVLFLKNRSLSAEPLLFEKQVEFTDTSLAGQSKKLAERRVSKTIGTLVTPIASNRKLCEFLFGLREIFFQDFWRLCLQIVQLLGHYKSISEQMFDLGQGGNTHKMEYFSRRVLERIYCLISHPNLSPKRHIE